MLIRKKIEGNVPSSEITPKQHFLSRRNLITGAAAAGVGVLALRSVPGLIHPDAVHADQKLEAASSKYTVPDAQTPFSKATTYNNFYEFGTDKEDPKDNSGRFHPLPWTVRVEGLVKKPADYHFEDLIKPYKVVDRTYRLRCVEAWSMVIPWQGIPLAEMINRFEPQPSAKFVAFTTILRPSEMPGQRRPILQWPYVEGLRMDEAMNGLTLMATGLYGKALPNQDGAPIRLVVPWKYGFKGIKSIVKIAFVDRQPETTWNIAAPDEYGFFANVNPEVDHPRWSQATERRIGEFRRRRTLMFNGYADQVASLYSGMDLRRNY